MLRTICRVPLTTFVLLALISHADAADSGIGDSGKYQRFVVHVAEYRPNVDVGVTKNAVEMLEVFRKQNVRPVREFRIPTLTDCVAVFSESKTFEVAQRDAQSLGKTNTQKGPPVLGTRLEIRTGSDSGKTIVNIAYTVGERQNGDKGSALTQIVIENTDIYSTGESRIIRSQTQDDRNVFLVITVYDGNTKDRISE